MPDCHTALGRIYIPSSQNRETLSYMGHWLVYLFPKAAITKYHKLGGWKQQKFIAPEFCRVEIKNQGVSRGMMLSETSRRESLLAFSSFWCSLTILGIPCLLGASLQSQHALSSDNLLECLFFSSYKYTRHTGLGADCTPVWSHFN